jgi:phage-related protein
VRSTVITALWHTFGRTIVGYLEGSIVRNIVQIVKGAFNVVEGLFRLFADLIHGRWAKVWDDVEADRPGAWADRRGVFRQALNTVVTIATLIGTGIVKAVGAGMSGLANLMGRLVHAGVDAVRNLIGAAGSAAQSIGSCGRWTGS